MGCKLNHLLFIKLNSVSYYKLYTPHEKWKKKCYYFHDFIKDIVQTHDFTPHLQ